MTKRWVADFWSDEQGLVLSAELIIIVTLVVLGLITGLVCLQQAVVGELQDVGFAIRGMNQSYYTPSFWGCRKIWGTTSWKSGSGFFDYNNGFIGGGAVGSAEIGTGGYVGDGGYVGGTGTVTTPRAPSAVVEERCVTCPEATQPPTAPNCATPQNITPAPCYDCLPNGPQSPTPRIPQAEPEIPQGPAPQILPQT